MMSLFFALAPLGDAAVEALDELRPLGLMRMEFRIQAKTLKQAWALANSTARDAWRAAWKRNYGGSEGIKIVGLEKLSETVE